MARRLVLLASIAAAGAALAACDNPSAGVLAKAQKGECFAVTGKDSMGQPKLIRADCATPGATLAPPAQAAASTPADPNATAVAPAGAAPAQTAAACVPVKPAPKPVAPAAPPPCAPGQIAHTGHALVTPKASTGRGLTYASAKSHRKAHKSVRVVRKAVRQKGKVHYVYVPASGEVFNSSQRYEYARTPQTDLAGGGYSYHREEAYVAPPPPPPPPPPAPPAYAYGHGQYQGGYAQGHQYQGGYAQGQSRQYQAQSRSYESRSYSSQSSSSARYSSSAQGSRRPCNCERDRRPVIIEEYSRDGYLTWPGKR